MIDQEKNRFMAALNGVGIAFKMTVSKDQARLYWSLFSEYSIEEFERACFEYLKRGKFFPAPSELLELMPSSRAKVHVSADEAWSIVIDSMDECATVALTKEIAEARSVAYDVYQSGDKIGARMAFREAYNRIIATAEPPRWFISRGFDKTRVEAAVQKAIAMGRISNDQAALYLENQQQGSMKALIDQSQSRDPSLREKLGEVVKRLSADNSEEAIKLREEKRKEFEERRRKALEQLSAIRSGLDDEKLA